MSDNYILIKNGVLISKEYNSEKNDILIKDEKIKEISPKIEGNNDWEIIDASGKLVAPGFIDFHSHCDFHFPFEEHAELYKPLIYQGVTTCFAGNCGFSVFPATIKNKNCFNELF